MALFSHQSNVRYRVLALMEVVLKPSAYIFGPRHPKWEAKSVFLQTTLWPGWWCPLVMSRCGFVHWGMVTHVALDVGNLPPRHAVLSLGSFPAWPGSVHHGWGLLGQMLQTAALP